MCYGCFFFEQKTAYEMRISDWSSDVCSSDLPAADLADLGGGEVRLRAAQRREQALGAAAVPAHRRRQSVAGMVRGRLGADDHRHDRDAAKSEEHTSELQSLMRISYAVFCLKKKKNKLNKTQILDKTYKH